MEMRGIVRRIDDLGRISIPKEMRLSHNILVGDELEILDTEEGILIRPYRQSLTNRLKLVSTEIIDICNRSGDKEYGDAITKQLNDLVDKLENLIEEGI